MTPRSTRLNGNNRDAFVSAVIEANLPQSKRPTDAQFKSRWDSKIYDIVYGPYIDIMKTLPKWFFAEMKSIRVRFQQGKKDLGTLYFDVPKACLVINPHSGYSHGIRVITEAPIPEDHQITTEFIAHRQAQADFETKRRELSKQTRDLVYSCNTSGQLYKAWPPAVNYAECFPYRGPNRHEGPTVSGTEMDITLKVSKATITLPDIE